MSDDEQRQHIVLIWATTTERQARCEDCKWHTEVVPVEQRDTVLAARLEHKATAGLVTK